MSRSGVVALSMLVVVGAACQTKHEDGGAGSGSGTASTAPPKPLVVLDGCAISQPRPTMMRRASEFPYGIGDGGSVEPGTSGFGAPGLGRSDLGARGRIATGPQLRLGLVLAQGAMDKAIIRRYVRRKFVEIEACYAKALATKADLEVTATFRFIVTAIGKVEKLEVKGVEGAFATCLAKVVSAIEFPAGKSGGVTMVEVPLGFAPQPTAPPPKEIATEWTPYSVAPVALPAEPATMTAVEAAVNSALAEVDACFGGTAGSVRAHLAIAADGKVRRARVGGLGAAAAEVCIATALQKLSVPAPSASTEIACDLSRGGPAPWRVTTAAYTTLAVDKTAPTLERPSKPPAYLVLATPGATGDAINSGVTTAQTGKVSIVAVEAAGGAPVFVGVGPDLDTDLGYERILGIAVTNGIARVCANDEITVQAPVIDPGALDKLIATGLLACKPACTSASIGVVGDYVGKDLVAVSAAIRRAKLPALVGGVGCPPAGP